MLKRSLFLALLLLLVSLPVFCLTPSERAELIQIRDLLIKSEQKNTEAIEKLKLSELELEKQADIIIQLERVLEEHQTTLSNLEILHEKQLKELTDYYQNRERGIKIKTAVISGGVGFGVGFLIAVILLF
jgi:uncharacterized protein (DUF3084 family)